MSEVKGVPVPVEAEIIWLAFLTLVLFIRIFVQTISSIYAEHTWVYSDEIKQVVSVMRSVGMEATP